MKTTRRKKPADTYTLTGFTSQKREAILASLGQGAYVRDACKAADISHMTFYNWLARDDDFAADVDAAMQSRIKVVEDALFRKAESGNVTACIFWLCNRDKGRWEHVAKIEHKGGMDIVHKADLAGLIEAARNNGHDADKSISDRAAFLRRGLIGDTN